MKLDAETQTDNLRALEMEIMKLSQQKDHMEEDLEIVLCDADLDEFKVLQE